MLGCCLACKEYDDGSCCCTGVYQHFFKLDALVHTESMHKYTRVFIHPFSHQLYTVTLGHDRHIECKDKNKKSR